MFYLLKKEGGITSFKFIRSFAKENNIKKIGHTGTLDPLATGLLLIATDDDTKLIEYVDKGFKTYEVECILGKTSDTYDIEGNIISTAEVDLSKETVVQAIKSFVGTQKQMPPIFSAKKINGQKAYDLARAGKEVKLKEVEITVKDIKDIKQINSTTYSFALIVSRGTYIRSIIHDLGQQLKCGAIMSKLTRTSLGSLTFDDLGPLESIEDLLIYPSIKLINNQDYINLINGKQVKIKYDNGRYGLKYNSDIIGIIEIKDNTIIPIKLIGNKFRKRGF